MTYMYTSHCSLFISLSCTPGDVYCLNNSCHGAQLTFDASTHCIVTSPTALDDLVGATLTFGANSKNTLECPGKCAAQIDLQAGACLHVNCPGRTSVQQRLRCLLPMVVCFWWVLRLLEEVITQNAQEL